MTHRYTLTFVLLLCCFFSSAQLLDLEIGNISNIEMNIKEFSADPDAEALVISDEAFSDYDDDHRLITIRRIRIKILNQKGLDRGNIIIPFYSKDGFEIIDKIEAITYNYNENNSIIKTVLDKKSVFTEKRDAYYSLKKFAMPAVKPGCIIEYKYESIMKHYGGLDEWVFQSDIPVLRSSFKLRVIPGAAFAYIVQKSRTFNMTVTPLPDIGGVFFEMKNVPALRFEPYMDAKRDYLQKVTFQLSGITNRLGSKQEDRKSVV